MLPISEELKRQYLTDSVNKNIVVPFTDSESDVSGVNWYTGWSAYGITGHLDAKGDLTIFCNYDGTNWSTQFNDYVYNKYLDYAQYIYISCKFTISAYTLLPTEMMFACHYTDKNNQGWGGVEYVFNPNDYITELMGDGLRIYTRIEASKLKRFNEIALYCRSGGVDMTYGIGDIQVQSSNILYTESDFYNHNHTNPLPYMGESIIRQGLNPLDYITLGKPYIADITNDDIDFQNFKLQENLCSSDNLKFGACESSYVNFTVYGRTQDFKDRDIAPYITTDPDDVQAKIPLGCYTVSEVKRSQSHNLVKTEITAYDKLTLLDQNAMNWYTLYMYAMSTDSYQTAWGYEFTRQIYSSYFNIMKYLGLEKRVNYNETIIQSHTDSADINSAYANNGHKDITYYDENSNALYVRYAKYSVNNPDTRKPYVVDISNVNGKTDDEIKADAPCYELYVDSECRGLVGVGNVLIVETLSNNTTHSFLCDSGDYFMLSPSCTKFDVYWTWNFTNNILGAPALVYATGGVTISRVEKDIELTNAAIRLLYYNWGTREIFPCESSVTARDVVRSLLEVCGCLFKLDRYGMPKFLYPTVNALYPSETLYPADDLYPRGLDGSLLSMGRYISFEYEDYEVQNYGRIQIVKNINTNDITSICEWEYEGNPNEINTYLIEDNIFYCAAQMEYDYDNMGDVAEMLENMYNRIANMRYHPHLTNAIGMPWVEVGDRIGLLTVDNGIESFIYRRTLKGVQVLQDLYEAQGDEYIEKVKDYNYSQWEG